MINKCINFIQEVIFAQACLNCSQLSDSAIAICTECLPKLPANEVCCRQCALPLESAQQQICGKCQKTAPAFDSAFIPFIYEHPVDRWIWKFKFRNDLVTGKLLADLFIQKMQKSDVTLPEVLVPVPLHDSRLKQRGFNQSLWLARHIGKQLGIPVDTGSVKRQLKTPPQHELHGTERKTLLKNAFTLRQRFEYQHVAVVDDVLTSGTTVNEISKLLRSHATERIDCWAMARTPLK